MVNIQIIVLTLAVSFLTVFLGYLFDLKLKNNDKEQTGLFLKVGGYLMMVIIGIIILTNPIVFESGSTSFEEYNYNNATLINVTTTNNIIYSQQNDSLTNFLAWVIMLAGLGGSITSVMNYFSSRTDRMNDPNFKG